MNVKKWPDNGLVVRRGAGSRGAVNRVLVAVWVDAGALRLGVVSSVCAVWCVCAVSVVNNGRLTVNLVVDQIVVRCSDCGASVAGLVAWADVLVVSCD